MKGKFSATFVIELGTFNSSIWLHCSFKHATIVIYASTYLESCMRHKPRVL